jgi:hypothetical protein
MFLRKLLFGLSGGKILRAYSYSALIVGHFETRLFLSSFIIPSSLYFDVRWCQSGCFINPGDEGTGFFGEKLPIVANPIYFLMKKSGEAEEAQLLLKMFFTF